MSHVAKDVVVIGAGFAGLSAACFLAQAGYEVTIVEKNSSIGGRCRSFEAEGFTFDMGPSWYWMPDVFDRFFEQFGRKTSELYELERLDPSYQVFFENEITPLPADYNELKALFEKIEPGSAIQLEKFLKSAQYKYEQGMGTYVHKPSLSPIEFLDGKVLKSFLRLNMLSSIASEIKAKFKNPKLIELLSFPVLFLGAKPVDTPAMYSLMNYADIKLGTWYPKGGMVEIPKAMGKVAQDLGVQIILNESVSHFDFVKNRITAVNTETRTIHADHVISTADYHHTEQAILPQALRTYTSDYWDKRVMAPSSLLFYIGVNKKIEGLEHHNLWFDTDFDRHAEQIYDQPEWPDQPLFYVCCPSKTDASVAPEGQENLFLLVPLAADLTDTEEHREKIFALIMDRMEARLGQEIRSNIVYKRSFCVEDFKSEYNSFKGNAYGLANTLMQTAFLKPRMKSKKVSNLLYAGQLTTPGPGVPPSLISGEVAAKYLMKYYN